MNLLALLVFFIAKLEKRIYEKHYIFFYDKIFLDKFLDGYSLLESIVKDVYMTLLKKLGEYRKKTITRAELEEYTGKIPDEELYSEIDICVKKGYLQPVISSRTNGNNLFPIHDKYKVILPKKDYSGVIEDIKSLHPLLINNDYLLSKPDLYLKYKSFFACINSWLFNNSNKSVIEISRKERAFEIFNEEKTLDNKSFWQLLNSIGINKTILKFYDTPEYCFNDYIPRKKDNLNLIICENKDIWFNLRKLMFEEGINCFCGLNFDGVIYGNGNKISKESALTEYTRFLGYDFDSVRYYYWGDIDKEGFEIFNRVVNENQRISITLFIEAYKLMLDLAENRIIPDSDDNRSHNLNYNFIYELFDADYASELKKYIEANKRLPQEIVSYAQLKKVVEKI